MAEASTPDQPSTSRSATADGSWMAWSAAGIAGIWVAVVLISTLAPDMVTGSEQEHMPIAAATSWLWGLISTIGFLWAMSKLRGRASRRPICAMVTPPAAAILTALAGVTAGVFASTPDPR